MDETNYVEDYLLKDLYDDLTTSELERIVRDMKAAEATGWRNLHLVHEAEYENSYYVRVKGVRPETMPERVARQFEEGREQRRLEKIERATFERLKAKYENE